MLMRDGNEIDLLVPHSVDDAEGEASDQTLSKSSAHRRAGIRRLSDALRCLFDSNQELKTEPAETRFIEVRARVEFRPG
jgi:hypothetical protein